MGLDTKGHNMRFAIPTCAVAALLVTAPAMAEEAAKAETPTWTVTSNIGAFSQYIFRGIGYTQKQPAVQGGFDIAHKSGLYAGIWGSNVSSDAFAGSNLEIDLYGGYTNTVGEVTYDVGLLQFYYPNGRFSGPGGNERYDTLEAYAGLTWKMFNVKYSHALTDFFGLSAKNVATGGTSGSGYIEGNINYEFLPSWVLNLHAGHQHVENTPGASYADYWAGITKNFDGGWQASARWVDTSVSNTFYTFNGKDMGDSKALFYVKRTF